MVSTKSILTSIAFLAGIGTFVQVQGLPAISCEIPLEQDLPKDYKTYQLAGTKIDDENWDFTFVRDDHKDAPPNMDFKAHVKQQLSSGLVIEIDNYILQGPAPRKNYFYSIVSSRKKVSRFEDFDIVKYWLGPPDQCWGNHDYPGTSVIFADIISVFVHEYDV